jgi:hypothetical protein
MPTDHTRFTEGDCHILARAIHDATGWPMATFTARDDRPTDHAFVQMPDGRYLDIEGVKSYRDMVKVWGFRDEARRRDVIGLWTWESLIAKFDVWEEISWPSSPQVARRTARKLLWHGAACE